MMKQRSLFPDPPPELVNPFEQWWTLYPRKRARTAAQKAYRLVVQGKPELHAELMAGTVAAIKVWQIEGRDMKRFAPYPATFLNSGEWQLELPETFEPQAPEEAPWTLPGEPACALCGDTGFRPITRRGVSCVIDCDHRDNRAMDLECAEAIARDDHRETSKQPPPERGDGEASEQSASERRRKTTAGPAGLPEAEPRPAGSETDCRRPDAEAIPSQRGA